MTKTTLLPLFSFAACTLGGCFVDPTAEYFEGTYPGNGSYTATLPGNPTGLVGAAPLTAVLDGDSSIELGPNCVLGIASASIAGGRDGITSGAATIGPQQSCQLPVDGGSAVFTVEDGLVARSGDYAVDVSLGGALSSWQGTPTTGGYIDFTFQGLWTHN
jgi:hypothetical protein